VLSFVRWDTTASILASDANSMLSNAALAASGAHLASAKLGGEALVQRAAQVDNKSSSVFKRS